MWPRTRGALFFCLSSRMTKLRKYRNPGDEHKTVPLHSQGDGPAVRQDQLGLLRENGISENARCWFVRDSVDALRLNGFLMFLRVPARCGTWWCPQVNERELDGDWFQSIRDKLNWNLRTLQTPYHEHTSSELVDEESEEQSSPSARRALQPQFFTLPTSRATDKARSPKGESSRGSPI